jgi:hypothetical protein
LIFGSFCLGQKERKHITSGGLLSLFLSCVSLTALADRRGTHTAKRALKTKFCLSIVDASLFCLAGKLVVGRLSGTALTFCDFLVKQKVKN